MSLAVKGLRGNCGSRPKLLSLLHFFSIILSCNALISPTVSPALTKNSLISLTVLIVVLVKEGLENERAYLVWKPLIRYEFLERDYETFDALSIFLR